MIKIDQKRYADAWRRYESTYLVSDQILYDLFAKYTDHEDARQVLVKVQFIDALYATNLFKKVGIVNVVQSLCLVSAQNLFASLDNYKSNPVNNLDPKEILRDIAELHRQLVAHLHQYIGFDASVFVSKYMHFHRGDIVPILDGTAEEVLKKHFEGSLDNQKMQSKKTRYQEFCEHFEYLWRDALTFDNNQSMIVKKIDQYLYQYERTDKHLTRNYFS